MRLSILRLICLFFIASLMGCNTLSINDRAEAQFPVDPWQGMNRKVYAFNTGIDKLVVRPVAVNYVKIVPDPVKNSVNNFLSNLREPLYVVNNLLQGKVDGTLISTYRFIVNSTIGIGGLFDVAKYQGVEVAREDFGQTLATWGVKPGPYIMLPFLGPTNLRDLTGLVSETVAYYPYDELSDSSATSAGLTILNVTNIRSGFIGTDEILDQQLDPYSFLKVAYEENRLDEIYDGQPPEKEEEDFDF